MNGITVIEEHLCRAGELSAFIGIGIFITLLVAGTLLTYRLMYKKNLVDKSGKIAIIICSVLIIIVYSAFCVGQVIKYNTTHMEYTVTVNDNVSFNDFYEKYEIVSIDGNEYRVKEK